MEKNLPPGGCHKESDEKMQNVLLQDGIHGMLPREMMCEGAKKYWDFYNMVPGAGLFQKEFGFFTLKKWGFDGYWNAQPEQEKLFGFDPPGRVDMWNLGWTEAPLCPAFENKVLEDRGDYELVQDTVGRSVLFFKGRRKGFMPQYLDHPVKDRRTWEEKCRWRLDPDTPQRKIDMDAFMPDVIKKAKQGMFVGQSISGGCMYLRSMMGVEGMMYMLYDDPDLIHDCMKQWLTLMDSVIARHQKQVCIDELFISEDICYKNGALISPDMVREFFFPYYQQLLTNMKRRQLDPARPVHLQVDTDGYCPAVIDLYGEIGLNAMSPFEVAAGCDVVEIGKKYPSLRISGGLDKREIAKGPEAIDRMVDRILPVMKARGGYIPTCDHGVPEEVSLENYLYFRKRCLEFA